MATGNTNMEFRKRSSWPERLGVSLGMKHRDQALALALFSWPLTATISSADLRFIALASKITPTYPPFDGPSLKRKDHTVQNDHEGPLREAQGLWDFSRGWLGNNPLTPFAEQDAKFASEKSDSLGSVILSLQPREERGWH